MQLTTSLIALVERFIRTLKDEYTRVLDIPMRRRDFRPGLLASWNGTTSGGRIPSCVAGHRTKPITDGILLADIRDLNLVHAGHAGRHALPRKYRSEANRAFGSTCTWLTMLSKRICPSLSYGVPRSTFLLVTLAIALRADSQYNCYVLSFVKERLVSHRSNTGRMIDYTALLGRAYLRLAREEVRSAGPATLFTIRSTAPRTSS